MKKLFCLIAVAFLTLTTVSAQDYKWAAGIRTGGETIGLSVKYSLDGVNALEGIFAMPWDNGFTATVLYERHIPVITDGFHFYYGAGGHIGGWDHRFSLGIDGIIGLEYKVSAIPLAFSLDYKPVFNIADKTKFYMADIALGIRITF